LQIFHRISCVRLTGHRISNNRIENDKKSILGEARGCNGEKVWREALLEGGDWSFRLSALTCFSMSGELVLAVVKEVATGLLIGAGLERMEKGQVYGAIKDSGSCLG
jgi:hypothetical protein